MHASQRRSLAGLPTALAVLAAFAFVAVAPRTTVAKAAVAAPTYNWTSTGVQPRVGVIAFDDAAGSAVLFGGSSGSPYLADTWTWDGTSWTPRNSTPSPSNRYAPVMAYDPDSQTVILFGGEGDNGDLNDTWSWDGTNWTQLSPPNSPPARDSAAMTYDAATGSLVLFGGQDGGALRDTWTWKGGTWTQQDPISPPPGVAGAGGPTMADDVDSAKVLLLTQSCSGTPISCSGDTWSYDVSTSTWTDLGALVEPGLGARMVYDAAIGHVVLFGGRGCNPLCHGGPLLNGTWTWDDTSSSWVKQTLTTSPPARWTHAMVYDPVRQQVFVFGGCCVTSPADPNGTTFADPMGDWWTWDGGTGGWTQGGATASPPPRDFPSMAFDATRQNVVVFGGENGASRADTWTWDGANWTQQSPATSPSSRLDAAMADDPTNHQLVLFGGSTAQDTGTVIGGTWTWDGGAHEWTHQSPADSPAARQGAGMAYDPGTNGVVLFGGEGPNCPGSVPYCDDTWTWDGGTGQWTRQDPQHHPSPRSHFSMAYDAATGQVVLFGGEGCQDRPGALCDDTWIWTGNDWLEQVPTASPPPRYLASMAYDPTNQDVVLFGGLCAGDAFCPPDTWVWDGYDWSQLPTLATPPARYGGGMAFDPTGDAVLFGGWVQDPGADSGSFSFGAKPAVVRILGTPGGTVVTPNPVSSTHPLRTSVTVGTTAGGGLVSVAQPTPNVAPPAAVRFLQAQADVKAPHSKPAAPVTLTFTLDASLVGNRSAVNVFRSTVTRHPAQVGHCSTPGVLSPNPCISSQTRTASGGLRVIVLTTSASASWNFGVPGVSLTVARQGTGTGIVTSQPWGVSCGSVCRAGFPSGAVVTLKAFAAAGSVFTHWAGACAGGTCKLTMSAARAVTAKFVHRPDASIKLPSDSRYRGVGVYNGTGRHQTRSVKAKRTTTKTFDIAVRNAGTGVDGFRIKGGGGTTRFKVVYFAGRTGRTNITSAVEAGTYKLRYLAPNETHYIRMLVTVKDTAKPGTAFKRLVTARSLLAGVADDVVRGVVDVVR
jgi:hypothetical protein